MVVLVSHLLLLLPLGADASDGGVPREVNVTIAPGRGLTVAGERAAMTVRARVQLRDVVSASGSDLTNELAIKTARLHFSGFVWTKELTWALQLALATNDFESGNPSPIFDAYVESTHLRDANVRVGQFFVPFDRARTVREFALQLVDRQQVVTELSLDRDMGMSISSKNLFGLGGRLHYALGLFGGQGRNRAVAEKAPGFLWTARVAVKPMGDFDDDVEGDLERSPTPHLAVGLAAAFNKNTNRQRSTTGAVFTLGGFDQTHLAADAVFKFHGVSVLAEVLARSANEPLHERDGVREYSRSAWGYLVQAGVMVHPNVEVAARWDQLRFLSGDPALATLVQTQGREVGAGVNVYLNGHLAKAQLDWAMRFGAPGAPLTHSWRLVIDATF
jgi:hypothetical protein